jgi:hypothetical protein
MQHACSFEGMLHDGAAITAAVQLTSAAFSHPIVDHATNVKAHKTNSITHES